jgi:hypothetical protein
LLGNSPQQPKLCRDRPGPPRILPLHVLRFTGKRLPGYSELLLFYGIVSATEAKIPVYFA